MRIFVGGLGVVSNSDIEGLFSSLKASNFHITDKGFAFADIPDNQLNKCK